MAKITKKIKVAGELHFFVDVFRQYNTNKDIHINNFRNRIDKHPERNWTKEEITFRANNPLPPGSRIISKEKENGRVSRIYEAMLPGSGIAFFGDVRKLWRPTSAAL